MDQHPIPQNISSYQFRLIGDMTLRQFFLLLGGGVVGYMFYITNLPGIIKWFFIFIAVLMGVAFAFLPLEGRPLDQWLMAFIKTIYAPTRFFWKKDPKLPNYLNNQVIKAASQNIAPPTPLSVPKTLPDIDTPAIAKIDVLQNERLNQINLLFSQDQNANPTNSPPPLAPASPTGGSNSINHQQIALPTPPNTQYPIPNTPIKVAVQPMENISIVHTPSSPIENTILQDPATAGHPIISNQPAPIQTSLDGSTAVFNPNLPFPSISENPNTLMGMVTDQTGKIVENAVIEIKNQSGTVRATKTNRLGQFFLATPLSDDSYQIEIEKAGLTFSPISLKLEGKIYPPLDIKAVN